MWSKNKTPMTAAERLHVGHVKALPCAVCDAPGPSDAHEIEQGRWFTSVALCTDCHLGGFNGLHGQKRAWLLRKVTELDALNITLKRIFQC